MKKKQDYLAKLQVAFEHLHDCGARWRKTIAVPEKFQERTV